MNLANSKLNWTSYKSKCRNCTIQFLISLRMWLNSSLSTSTWWLISMKFYRLLKKHNKSLQLVEAILAAVQTHLFWTNDKWALTAEAEKTSQEIRKIVHLAPQTLKVAKIQFSIQIRIQWTLTWATTVRTATGTRPDRAVTNGKDLNAKMFKSSAAASNASKTNNKSSSNSSVNSNCHPRIC